MKDKFWGYLPITENEFKEIWKNSKIVLDTNILLNLYRYSEKTQKNVIKILDKQKERFIIPELVVKEFFSNRDEVIENHRSIRNKVIGDLKIPAMKSSIDKHRHISLNKEEIKKIIKNFEEKINKELDNCNIDDFYEKDIILEKMSDWFDGRLMDPMTENELEETYKEGEIRYENKVPPGYKDNNKPQSKNRFNDLVIWKQIIKFAKGENTNIIFITDDTKEDWMKIIHGKIIGPREELLNEFFKETNGQKIYIYTTEGFLKAYNEYSRDITIDSDTISEIEDFEKNFIKWKFDKIEPSSYTKKIKLNYYKQLVDSLEKENDKKFIFDNTIEKFKSVDDIREEVLVRRLEKIQFDLNQISQESYNEYFFKSTDNYNRAIEILNELNRCKYLFDKLLVSKDIDKSFYLERINELMIEAKELLEQFDFGF